MLYKLHGALKGEFIWTFQRTSCTYTFRVSLSHIKSQQMRNQTPVSGLVVAIFCNSGIIFQKFYPENVVAWWALVWVIIWCKLREFKLVADKRVSPLTRSTSTPSVESNSKMVTHTIEPHHMTTWLPSIKPNSRFTHFRLIRIFSTPSHRWIQPDRWKLELTP